MTTTDNAPKGLPPLNLAGGSYDFEKLYGAADKALEIEDETERQAYLDKVVRDHDHNKTAALDPSDTPGYTRHKRTHTIADGVKVTEHIQVPNHDPAEHQIADPETPQAEEATADPKPTTPSSPAPRSKKD